MSAVPQVHPPITSDKQCRVCGEVKPPSEFYVNWRYTDGLYGSCKKCNTATSRAWAQRNPEKAAHNRKSSHLRIRYGLSIAAYGAMLEAQHGRCASCGDQLHAGTSTQVDHDHECCPGKETCGRCVRGLLCGPCNAALGYIDDSVAKLRSLIVYLESHK
jgi:hypothetical protein